MPFTVLDFVLFHCLYWLFGFSSKTEVRLDKAGGVECHGAVAPLVKAKKRCGQAPHKSNNSQASHAVRGRGRGRGPVKVKANKVLLDAEAGASDRLLPLVKQSFKEGHYSPSTGTEEEWQIMVEQFIAMGVVVKDEVINIDSD
jgi:hypothetical protein